MEPAAPTISVRGNVVLIRQFAVTVTAGPDRGRSVQSQRDDLSIGTSQGTDLELTDAAVSRHHCLLRITERGLEVRDLGSTNGTMAGEIEVRHAYLKSGAQLRVGNTVITVELLDAQISHPLAQADRLGELIGASMAMRRLYPRIQQFAQSTATVLIDGETGTGKELAAETLHDCSSRRAGPFIVVDCATLSPELIESELFGHVRGAFTGADHDRIGAFEHADGGTIVLDEIGELPLSVQPVLLRALESRTIRRVGTALPVPVDVRVIASTHRDLRAEINQRRFRADLYYRLDVLRITMPPLRERPGDIALLAARFWHAIRPDSDPPPEFLAQLVQQSWPGNLRELRNAVERTVVAGGAPSAVTSYARAREQVVGAWEREWLGALVAAHGGNVSRAARVANMARSHLRELLARHGLGRPRDATDGDDDES